MAASNETIQYTSNDNFSHNTLKQENKNHELHANTSAVETTHSNANFNEEDSFEFNEDFNNDNWGDVEEKHMYPPSTPNNANSTSSNEWICHKCKFRNRRLLAIQNDHKCSKCGVDLIIINQQLLEQNERKYNETNTSHSLPSKDDIESKYNQQIHHHINMDTEIALSLQQDQLLSNTTNVMSDSNELRAKTDGNCTNKTISKLMLPNDAISVPLPINMKMTTNPYPRQMRNVSAVSDVYRPSFFDGTYGSYKYRTFESFQFPRNEIKANVTNTNVNNVPMKCELLEDFDDNDYVIHLRNGTEIQVN
eukprot:37504_1